ncbi:MAG: hypothetical protein AAF809_12640 [Bacteroidota bacterium]
MSNTTGSSRFENNDFAIAGNRLLSPVQWLSSSEGLLISAELLWKRFIDTQGLALGLMRNGVSADDAMNMTKASVKEGIACWMTAEMLYGLALETAMKGCLLKEKPDSFSLQVSMNGHADVIDVKLEKAGVSLQRNGHDLVQLSHMLDLYEESQFTRFSTQSEDREFLESVLRNLTIMILWGGKYPGPSKGKDLEGWAGFDRPDAKRHIGGARNLTTRLIRHLHSRISS